ncbi:YAP1-binding protein 1 [Coniosporium tulheliwenetii]|uniref:YAP1-binding protein 1 n=1 Tax=Coniosporium tulheliwenetii TaxID=3383036 RepID=A0ACC2YUS2_9PEZI|nr:YAP1-binding protein 1 [Cladosporium sp. JES 115]
MLSTLHLRIKTRYPSRFLSMTLQAILVAYDEGSTHINELSATVVNFVKTLSGTKRPHLPPRRGSSFALKPLISQTAPDPEAQAEPPSADEAALTHRLLQSFLTHVFEEHMLLLSSPDDVPGMAWSARAQEKLHPERIIPGKTTYAERFANSPELQERISIIGQLAALGLDLEITSEELLTIILDTTAEPHGLPSEEDDPPASAQDIPLSKHGALFMFTAREVSEVLHGARPTAPPINIFPQHATVLQNYIDIADPATIGTQEEAIVDTIIALGLLALSKNNIGEPASDEEFTLYLQSTSLLSANSPSPTLRYHAHYLTASVLRSHPSDTVRLSFIRDTLEHCPYENLKACAVGWLKGEIIEANPPTPLSASKSAAGPSSDPHAPSSTDQKDADPSIFTTPFALSTVAPHLFPDLTHDLAAPSLAESYTNFKTSLSFYLATLNFYYLLLCAKHLHGPLDVPGMHQENDIGGSYLWPLRQAVGRFREGLMEGGELAEEEGEEGWRRGWQS